MAKEICEMTAGRSFGECALESGGNETRSATVYVKSKICVAISIMKEDYKSVIGDSFKNCRELAIKCMRNFDIFQKLSDQLLKKLYDGFVEMNVGKDFVLFKQGDPIDGIYLLVKGQVEVYVAKKVNEFDFQTNKGSKISTIGENEIFGLEEIVNPKDISKTRRTTVMI